MPAASRARRHYLIAVTLCALTTLVCLPLRERFEQANIVMLYLLAVFLAAVRLGRGPALLAALASVAAFDVFFVPPYLSFKVVDPQYLVTLAVMLAVGLLASQQAAQLAERTEEAQSRERATQLLYELARQLGSALTPAQVGEIIDDFFADLGCQASLLVDTAEGATVELGARGGSRLDATQRDLALSAYDRNQPQRDGDGVTANLYLPFAGTTRVRGVLVVGPRPGATAAAPLQQALLDAVASLVGTAVERLHYAEVARRSELDAATEKLRASILSSISHDLRTPLTSLVGQADALADRQAALPDDAAETAGIIRDQAHAMHRMVSNLLELARLKSGRVVLNHRWQPFEEIVGSSLRLLDASLAGRRLTIELPAELPLLNFDAVLLERVLCNLLENAVKYSAAGAAIHLGGRLGNGELEISVCNDGLGFPPDRLGLVFEPFERGLQEPAVPGTGIGLAVCRAVIAAHGGRIVAENRPGQACVRFTLPLGSPPALEAEA